MSTTLSMADFAIVTYAVDPERVAALLPHTFEPETFTLDNGSHVVFVSAVSFRAESIAFGALRVPLGFVQVNYRAYVRRHGERCVWFFGTTVSSPLVNIPRALLGAPWRRVRSTLNATWDGGRCADYALQSRGDWGGADVECVGSGAPVDRLDGFHDLDETLAVLGSPLAGFFLRSNGSLIELRVRHATLEPQVGTVRVARYAAFEEIGLVEAGAQPHSALLQRWAPFEITSTTF
jgi:hypothetical protein